MEGVQLKLRWGAGVVALGVILGCVIGVIWGFLRPGYVAEVVDGGVQINHVLSPDSVEFASFGWFVILSTLLGMAVALVAYGTGERESNLSRMVFAACVALFSSWALYVLGQWSANLANPPHAAAESDTFTLVPAFQPGIAWCAAPFMASLAYWLGLVSTAAFEGGRGSVQVGE